MNYFWFIVVIFLIITASFLIAPFVVHKRMTTIRVYCKFLLLIVGFSVTVIVLYLHWGNYYKLSEYYANRDRAAQIKLAMKQFGSREKIITALKTKLEHLPTTRETARGWYLLGKLYLSNQQMTEGMNSLSKAFSLDPNNPEIILGFVTAKYYMDKQLDDFSKQLLRKVTSFLQYKAPALNLLASNAYQTKHYDEAIADWEELLQLLPPDSQESQDLLLVIAQTQRLRAQASPNTTNTVKLRITVQITKQLQQQLKTSDILFVYALNTSGPKIPLAVKKLTIGEFPMEVSLDDTNAMLPGRNLSSVNVVKVEARISKSGRPQPESGDFVGSTVLNTHQSAIQTILIKDQLP